MDMKCTAKKIWKTYIEDQDEESLFINARCAITMTQNSSNVVGDFSGQIVLFVESYWSSEHVKMRAALSETPQILLGDIG